MGFLDNLRRDGISEKSIRNENLLNVLRELKEKGIVYEKKVNNRNVFVLSRNAKMSETNEGVTKFELYPNMFMGVLFDCCDVFEISGLNKKAPDNYWLIYALNPTMDMINNFGLGSKVKYKVLAKGSNGDNESVLVKLPASEESLFKMGRKPCISIGLSEYGKNRFAHTVEFEEEINGKFIEGTRVLVVDKDLYTDISKVEMDVQKYSLIYDQGKYKVEEGNKKARK